MSKAIHFKTEDQRQFYKVFQGLCDAHSSWQVWADLIFMMACAISNALEPREKVRGSREEEFKRTASRYTQKEQAVMAELFGITVEALERDPDQDFLGELFMCLGLGSHWKGQFFTPYDICRAMAQITMDGLEPRIEAQGWVSICDTCCGAGALLVAARNEMVRKNIPRTGGLFVAQDIDRTAALMCYIQLSLLGCAGYVVVADSLRYPLVGHPLDLIFTPEQEAWIMPMMYERVWMYRRVWHQIDMLTRPIASPVEPSAGTEDAAPAGKKKKITKR